MTGRASSLKISAPITPHGMYFPSTPLSLPALWWMVLRGGRIKGETGYCNLVSAERITFKPACVCFLSISPLKNNVKFCYLMFSIIIQVTNVAECIDAALTVYGSETLADGLTYIAHKQRPDGSWYG